MPRKHNYRRITRGLRFRLTFSYALFFAVLLGGVADRLHLPKPSTGVCGDHSGLAPETFTT